MLKLLLILPWIGAGIAAYWYTETNGSRIKKHDAKLYEELKNDKDGKKAKEMKDKLEEKKTLLAESDFKLKELKAKNKDDLTTEEEASMKKLEGEIIPQQIKEVEVIQAVDGKMWMPILSLTNIGWFVGIFLVSGLVGHFITKKVLSMFSDSEK